MAGTKKKNGNPSRPNDVREAKRIARNIREKVDATVTGSSQSSEASDDIYDEDRANGRKRRKRIGVSPNERRCAARGVRVEMKDEKAGILVGYVGSMAQTIEKLVKSRTDIKYVRTAKIKREVEAEMSGLKDSIVELKEILSNALSKLTNKL